MAKETRKLQAPDDMRKVAFIGFSIIFVAFGAVGGWAATAPLGSAAIGSGVIAAETNRKTVQHFEGGILSKINVREGDHVKAGAVLFKLDATQPQANYDIYRNQLVNALAQEARLIAEQTESPQINFPEELSKLADSVAVQDVMLDQQKQFERRAGSLAAQIALLKSKMVQLRTEIGGLVEEQEGRTRQVAFLVDEISGLKELFDRGHAPKTRLLALEREKAALEGQIGRSKADQAKAENGINEADLQIRQLRQQFFEQAIKDLVDVRSKISDLREKVTVSRDVLRRLDVFAPVTGTVQNMKVFTVGAVIRSGEPLIDVVPDNDELIVQAQFSPSDIDSFQIGSQAEIRFSSFHNRSLPMIPGTVRSISRDRLIDEATKQPYYLVIVAVNQSALPSELTGKVMPGLPIEIIIPTTQRTVVEYLVQPLMSTLRKTMRER